MKIPLCLCHVLLCSFLPAGFGALPAEALSDFELAGSDSAAAEFGSGTTGIGAIEARTMDSVIFTFLMCFRHTMILHVELHFFSFLLRETIYFGVITF